MQFVSRPIQECDRSKNATIPNIRSQKLSANGPLPTRTRRNGELSDFVTSRVSSPERYHLSVIAQVSSSGCHHSRVVAWVSVLKFYIMIGAKSVSGMEWIRLPVRKGCGTGRNRHRKRSVHLTESVRLPFHDVMRHECVTFPTRSRLSVRSACGTESIPHRNLYVLLAELVP